MNGTNIGGFDLSAPADTNSAGLGDDVLRSIKSTFQTALNDEHVFDSAGGVVGHHRPGSAKAYFGTQSQVSSSGTDGRLMVTSDTSRLFGVGSGGTVFLGDPRMIAASEWPSGAGVSPARHFWQDEWGYGITSSSGSTVVTIPNSGYSGMPIIMLSHQVTSPLASAPALSYMTISASVFHVRAVGSGSLVSDIAFTWMSRGTRAL